VSTPIDPGAPTLLAPGATNAIGRMLGLLGDEWNLHIIRQALLHTSRYSQFMTHLTISNSVLTSRLNNLVAHGLLTRRVHESTRARTEYLTTPRSRSLWTVLLSIWAWELAWVVEDPGQLPQAVHQTCGHAFVPVLRCESCRARATSEDISMRLGPSGAWDRSVPAASTRRRSDPGQPEEDGLSTETMSMFGNRWAAALLLALFLGTTRFNDLQSQLRAPPSLLAERLHTFCALDVLVTRPTEHVGPERAAYLLTSKGRAFFPVLVTALQWTQHWYRAPEGPAMTLTHQTCGAEFTGELACNKCGQRLSHSDLAPGIA